MYSIRDLGGPVEQKRTLMPNCWQRKEQRCRYMCRLRLLLFSLRRFVPAESCVLYAVLLIMRRFDCEHSKPAGLKCPYMFFLCRLQRGVCVQHEAGVEIPGQDEVSEETLHHPLPRLPHHLPPLPESVHRRRLCAG